MSSLKMYSTREVAELIGVSISTIHNEIVRGNLKANQVGKLWRISEKNLLEYINHVTEKLEERKPKPKTLQPTLPKVPPLKPVEIPPDLAEQMMTPKPKPASQGTQEIPPSNLPLIVTRHEGIIQWLKARGIAGPSLPRADYADVRGRIVIGELPIWLIAECKSFYRIEYTYARIEDRGREWTATDMDRLGAHLVRYTATRSQATDRMVREELAVLQANANGR